MGALAVALAARHARIYSEVDGDRYLEELRSSLPQDAATEFLPLMEAARRSATAGESTTAFAEAQGWRRGVSGYVYRTVPAAVHAWLRHRRDFRAAVTEVIRCGGDTDTTAAIVGGIIGSRRRKGRYPTRLARHIVRVAANGCLDGAIGRGAWPDSGRGQNRPTSSPLRGWDYSGRNQFFLLIVLAHVLRRCLPPY